MEVKKPSADWKELAGWAAELRHEKGITQDALADMLGIARITIGRMEHKKVVPQIDTFLKVVGAMGYGVQIVPLEDEKNPGEDTPELND